MRKQRGFTLVELIVVVIVIGILATVAIPQYLKATERAKGGKARNALGMISAAEKLRRSEIDTYVAVANDGALVGALGTYVEMDAIAADTDWNYSVALAGNNFTATAQRVPGGANAGETITLTDTGVWAGSFTP